MQQPSLPPAALQPQLRLKFACRAASALRYVDVCRSMISHPRLAFAKRVASRVSPACQAFDKIDLPRARSRRRVAPVVGGAAGHASLKRERPAAAGR
jgi:hypothetical protein